MDVTKSPEQQLADALAELAQTKQRAATAEQALNTERDLRGKAEQSLTDANNLVDQLNEQANAQPTASKAPEAKLGSGATAKTYRIVVPRFQLAGFGTVEAADVKSNSDLLKKLVEVGSGVIELVVAKPAAE